MSAPDNGDRFIPTQTFDNLINAYALTNPVNTGDKFIAVLSEDGILTAKKVVMAESAGDRCFPVLAADNKIVLVKGDTAVQTHAYRSPAIKTGNIYGNSRFGATPPPLTDFNGRVGVGQGLHDANDWTSTVSNTLRKTRDRNHNPANRDWVVEIGTVEMTVTFNASAGTYTAGSHTDYYKGIWEKAATDGAFLRVLLTGTATYDPGLVWEKFNYNFQLFSESVPEFERTINDGAEAVTTLASPVATGVGVGYGQAWKFDSPTLERAGYVDFELPASVFQGDSIGGGNYTWGMKFYIRIDRSDTFTSTQPNVSDPPDPLHEHLVAIKDMGTESDPGNVVKPGFALYDDTWAYGGIWI